MNILSRTVFAVLISASAALTAHAQVGNFSSLNVTNNGNVGGTLTANLLRGGVNTQGKTIVTGGADIQLQSGFLYMGLGDIVQAGFIDCVGLTIGWAGAPTGPSSAEVFCYGSFTATDYMAASTYMLSAGNAFFGAYQGGYALTVTSNNGSVVLKKAQGDISMGIFGN